MKVKISSIVENQFPEFIKVESPLLVEFIKQYFVSQETKGAPIDLITNLDEYTKLENLTNQIQSTVLTDDIAFDDVVIPVQSTQGFLDTYGLIQIDSEIITYTSKTETSFVGCVRGFSGIYNDNFEFKTTESDFHNKDVVVQNLSILFLNKFLEKIKKKLIPGFQGRQLVEGLNQTTFIEKSKSFYTSKGTDSSFEILFNALYGEPVEVIRPRDYLITPSAAEYRVSKDLVVEALVGDPLLLENGTLFQDDKNGNNIAKGAISKVEQISRGDGTYYVVSLDYDFNKDINVSGSVFGEFYVHSKTQLTSNLLTNSETIDVDSTVGFPESGELILDGDLISYTSKSLTQFFGCSNILKNYSKGTDVLVNDFAYGISDNTAIAVRITGVIKELTELDNAYYLNVGDNIRIKSLGKTSTDIRTKNWFYNIPVSYKLSSINLIDVNSSKYQVTTIDENFIISGDGIDIVYKNGDVITTSVINRESNKTFIIQGQGALSFSSIDYIELKISKAFASNYPEISSIAANVQNVYEGDENVYVASTSIPSYYNESLEVNDRGLTLTQNVQGFTINKLHHGFLSGDVVIYNFEENCNHLGIPKGAYYIKKNSTDSISLASSRANLVANLLIQFSGNATISGTSKISYNDLNNKSLKSQKLIREIPKTRLVQEKVETPTGNIGILNNGVEIVNYKSKDAVFYGPVQTIDVVSSGENYDVINPPKITTTDISGSGLVAHCGVKGYLKEIRIIDRGLNFTSEPTIKISGGNGNGAKAKAEVGLFEHSATFDSSNINSNIIGFTTYHGFNHSEKIIYKPDGISRVLGITTDAEYFVAKIDDSKIKLHSSSSDVLSGINTISISYTGFANHRFVSALSKTKISSIIVSDSGSGYTNKRVSVNSSGINTTNNTINIPQHGFKTGEKIVYETYTNSPIVGLTTNTSYYVTAEDDYFKLSPIATAGISTSEDFFFKTNQYVSLISSGIGTHYFNYEPISVEISSVSGIATTVATFSAKIQPIFRGEISSVFIENGGKNYGQQNILNYNRQPNISVSSGSGAIIQGIVAEGRINQILIIDSGSGYYAPPTISINGTGRNAELTPVIENGQLIDVKILNAGYGYDAQNITLNVVPAGSGGLLRTNTKQWTINQIERYISSNQITLDDGFLVNGINSKYELQYVHGYAPRKLRRISIGTKFVSGELVYQEDLKIVNNTEVPSDSHSPIIGWSYDGHPIYGPYGFDKEDGGQIRYMKSSYALNVNQDNRPDVALYPEGLFVEDFVFNNEGDLDEHNGRYCITPEFPKGIYAYFATIRGDEIQSDGPFENYFRPTFPYFIGTTYKSSFTSFNFDYNSNQDQIDLNKTNWLRNTAHYNLKSSTSNYNYIFKPFDIIEQTARVNSTLSGSVESINVTNSGDNYKVDDTIIFDNNSTGGSNVRAKVSLIKGKTVKEIGVASTSVFNVEFYQKSQQGLVGMTTIPHPFNDGDTVIISNSNKNKKLLDNTINIKVSKNSLILNKDVDILPLTGITTYINVYGNLNIESNDIYQLDSEKIKVLNVDVDSSRLYIERGYSGSTTGYHTTGATLTEIPRRFTANIENTSFLNSKVNKELYFIPSESLGVGIGSTIIFSNPGVGITNIFIPSKSIYIPQHNLVTGEKLQYNVNGGSGIIVSNNGINTSVLRNGAEVYVVKYSDNFIGVSTEKVGIGTTGTFIGFNTTSPAKILSYHFFGSGDKHSFKTTYDATTSQVDRHLANVFTTSPPQLLNDDVINVSVKPTTTKIVKVSYNSFRQLLTVNPKVFDSNDVDTLNDIITLVNHNYFTGQKILYKSNSPIVGLSDNGLYYVVVKNSNKISLCSNYYDSQLENPILINLSSQSSGTFFEVNPRIEIVKNQNLTFDLSDSSLSIFDGSQLVPAFDFKLFTDKRFINEFRTTNASKTFNVLKTGIVGINTNANLSVTYDDKIPSELYYNLIPLKSLSVFVDNENNETNNIINYVDSTYSGKYQVTGIGTTSFSYILQNYPESEKYTQNVSYTTSSKNTQGGIEKVALISGGINYKSLPGISSIKSEQGSGAILEVSSKSIGRINNISINDIGYDYPADLTLTPLTQTPVVLKIIPQSALDVVGISSQGRNYLTAPNLILLDGLTLKQITDVDLRYELGDTEVKIVKNSKGINNIKPIIIPTNNSNAIGINSISFNSTTKEVTVVLFESYSTLNEFPFRVGDKVLVENVSILEDVLAKGYNSSSYDYARFIVTAINPNLGFSNGSVTYNLQDYLGEDEYPGTPDFGFITGTIIPESSFPIFDIKLKKNVFLQEETITSGDSSGIVQYWNKDNELLTISTNSEFHPGQIIVASDSLSSGVVDKVFSFNSKYEIDSSSIVRKGWRTEKGFLDNEFQHIQDNNYYQTFSYSLKSKVDYNTWDNAISSLNHTAGFKKFADLIIESEYEEEDVVLDPSVVDLIISIESDVDLNCIDDFDLATENNYLVDDELGSNEIYLKSQIISDYTEVLGNRVLLLDDISPQFNGKLKQFELKSNGLNVFSRTFSGISSSVVDVTNNRLILNNHYFTNGEKVIYNYDVAPIGISTTTITGIGATNKLPNEVYIIKYSDSAIGFSTSAEAALREIPLPIVITSVGIGSSHTLTSTSQNSKAIITLGGIIQTPVTRTQVTTQLSANVGIASTVIFFHDTSSFSSGDFSIIDDEIFKVVSVGLAATNSLHIERGLVGTAVTTHNNNTTVYKISGDYNIINNTLHFVDAPKGPTPIGTTTGSIEDYDYVGITTTLDFTARVFLRNGELNDIKDAYATNYVFDDISSGFNGITTTFILKSKGSNITGFADNNGAVLIGEVFQSPSDFDGVYKTYGGYTLKETSGITSIRFLSSSEPQSYNSNVSNIPIGGNIVAIGYTENFGFQPLVAAGGTAIVSIAGTIQSISIGNSGSGYRPGLQTINVGVYVSTTDKVNKTIVGIASVINGRVVSVAITNPGSGFSIASPPIVKFDDPIPYHDIPLRYVYPQSGIGTGAKANVKVGMGASIIELDFTNRGFGYNKGDVLTLDVGGTSGIPTFVYLASTEGGGGGGGGGLYPTCTNGLSLNTIASSGPSGYTCTLGNVDYTFSNDIGEFNLPDGNGYIDFVNSGTTQQIIIQNLNFQGIGVFSYAIKGGTTIINNVVQTFTQIPSEPPPYYSDLYATVPGNNIDVLVELETDTSQGYPDDPYLKSITHTITLTPSGGGGGGGGAGITSERYSPLLITVEDIYRQKFAGWTFGQVKIIDSIENLFNNSRRIFPIKLDNELQSIRARVGSSIDVNALFLIFINNVLQKPGYNYTIFGSSYIVFDEPPREGSTCLILFYRGNGTTDIIDVEVISPLKEGDGVQLKDDNGFEENERIVSNILSSDAVLTIPYNGPNIVQDINYLRPIKLCMQTEDVFINGKEVPKNREIYEPIIEPTTNLIKSINGTTNTIFIENIRTFFDDQRENVAENYKNQLKIFSQDEIKVAIATAFVSTSGTISSVFINDSGRGYSTPPIISFSTPIGFGTTFRATANATISSGSISSITVLNPGSNYSQSSPPSILIDNPLGLMEDVTSLTITGDFGYITGIQTTTVGIASTALIFNFFIPPESPLRITSITGTAVTVSGIQNDYYFVVKNTFVGNGITSLERNGSLLSIGSSCIDNVYNVTNVSIGQSFVTGIGTTFVARVTTQVSNNSIVGLGFTQIYGTYSWGRIVTKPRTSNTSFTVYNNGISGINSSPLIKRVNPLKNKNYT